MNPFRRQPKAIRAFLLEGQITDESAQQCIAMLLFWRMEDPKAPGRLVIDSPGGSITATFAILDTMDFVGFPIHTHCPTFAAGGAISILARGTKGLRSADRSATIQLCPTMGGLANATRDPEVIAKFMMKTRARILDDLSRATGRSVKEIADAQEQERAFSAEEAQTYGFIDTVTPGT